MVGLALPVPAHVGHFSDVSMTTSGLARCLVICIRPNLLSGRMVCCALSFLMKSFIAANNLDLLSDRRISIKSIMIKPPRSLNLNWRAISSAASRLTAMAASSWFFLCILGPLFTSMTCMASVPSTTI